MVHVAGGRLLRRALGLVLVVLSAALLVGVGGAFAHGGDGGRGPTISVLSGRADLVSGGDALISIGRVHSFRSLSVRAAGRDRTSAFTRAAGGTWVGLIRGLPLGRSSVIEIGRAHV